jgi:arylsulfatase A-like enzyme
MPAAAPGAPRRRWPAGAGLAALLGLGCARAPDVVFITVDTLRADHVGALVDGAPARTPHLDALAAEGVVYRNAWSPISVTGPAFCTLFTGREPGSHGVVQNVFRGGGALPDAELTLAERLGPHGYRAGAFVSGFTLREDLNLTQGFHSYSGPGRGNRRAGHLTADAAWAWLGLQVDPVLLWYHTYDVHGHLKDLPEPRLNRGWARDPAQLAHIPAYQRIDGVSDPRFYAGRYASAVELADAQVGRVVEMLRAAGRYENALIIVTADHGESFTERPLWFDHGTEATEDQLRVPLIVRYPDGHAAGTVVDAMVGLHDLVPTVLDVLGLDPSGADSGGGPPIDGRSLRGDAPGHPALRGESSHCKDEEVLPCRPRGPRGKVLAWREPDRLTLYRPESEGVVWEVYARDADPRELRPTGELPSEAARAVLLEMADRRAQIAAAEAEGAPAAAPGGDAELEALKALGYVDPGAP